MSDAQFNDMSNLSTYLSSRRSGRPRNMIAPGPTDSDIEEIVATAMRTPDHGKLNPWRVVQIGNDQRKAFSDGLCAAYRKENPDAGRLEIAAMETLAREAPALLVVLFSPRESTKIPLWEQELSCGAFCMNILHAIHAKGFVGGWITGWPAYNDDVRDLFGGPPEKIAGFIYSGSSNSALKERPRPELGAVLSKWDGKSET